MEIHSIGFTKRTAESFFGALKGARIELLIDVRLRNDSQLAGFAKKKDLAYFLDQLVNAEYVHDIRLAPTPELLSSYRKGSLDWAAYAAEFIRLLKERRVEETIDRTLFQHRAVLLCSERTPEHCHRRLVIEYLGQAWGDVRGIHL